MHDSALTAALENIGMRPKATSPFCYWCDPSYLEAWMVDAATGNVCRCTPGVGCGRAQCPAVEDLRGELTP